MRSHDLDDDLAEFDPDNPDHYFDDPDFDAPVTDPDHEAAVFTLLRRRAGHLKRIAEADATVERERRRWEAWHADRTAGMRREIERIEAAVEAWIRFDGRKTFPTPYGVTPKLRQAQPRLEVIDEKALVAWAQENHYDGLLKVEPRIAEVRKMQPGPTIDDYVSIEAPDEKVTAVLLLDDGNPVPGVALVTPVDKRFSMGKAKEKD